MDFGINIFIVPLSKHHPMIFLFLLQRTGNMDILTVLRVIYSINILNGVFLPSNIVNYGTWIILILVHNRAKMELLVGIYVNRFINILAKVYLFGVICEG